MEHAGAPVISPGTASNGVEPLQDMAPAIRRLAEKVWLSAAKTPRVGRTVVLKLKTANFRVLTRSNTPPQPPASGEDLTRIAIALLERVELGREVRYRLVGVGLGNFRDPDDLQPQPELFADQRVTPACD